MHVDMRVSAGVRRARLARAAYALRASGRRSVVGRIDGDRVRIEVARSARTASVMSVSLTDGAGNAETLESKATGVVTQEVNDDGGRFEASSRLEGELGFGLAAFGRGFTGTPNLGFALSDNAREVRLGRRLTSAVPGDPGFEVSLDATRREAANAAAEHGAMLRAVIRW